MFSHVVIFWTDPTIPTAADELVAGTKILKGVPGVVQLHAGKMVPSHRPVVDQSYQVGLNISFSTKEAERAYQTHPIHLEFVEKYAKPLAKKVVVYDFE